jgi:glyceraldehyde-3-phosphate dehydrogenase/erythrose-4-phosphate dehydrogenase
MVITDDTLANAASAIAALLPAVTGTLLAAASAIPTFNVSGIEVFFSAHGALPTNVDYSQMLLATAVPDDIKSAVQKAAESEFVLACSHLIHCSC